MNKKIFIFLAIALLCLFSYFIIMHNSISFKAPNYMEFSAYEKEQSLLEVFIESHFMEQGFFRTNLHNIESSELASGEDILSESIGLLMIYYIRKDRPADFDVQFQILQKYYLNNNQLIQWRIRPIIFENNVNATLDDLRIAKALILADKKWRNSDYLIFAEKLSHKLLLHCVDGIKLKSYDHQDSPEAPFVYYDFKAMNLLSSFNPQWNKIANKNASHILNQRIGGDMPFYEKNWHTKAEDYPLIENLMIMMHFSEVGIEDSRGLAWLRRQMETDGLFSSYSEEGIALTNIESPAIYGIVACIAKLNGDEILYHLACAHLKRMQNFENNEYYGGFIDLSNNLAFSFDQLFALLGY